MGFGFKCFILMKLFPEIRERKREETLIIIQLYPSLVLSITALIPPPPPISPPLY